MCKVQMNGTSCKSLDVGVCRDIDDSDIPVESVVGDSLDPGHVNESFSESQHFC
jgi:hypothetical protein